MFFGQILLHTTTERRAVTLTEIASGLARKWENTDFFPICLAVGKYLLSMPRSGGHFFGLLHV
ncbi:hypothetical protein ATO9_22680 [Pseudooceanicola atlanticus]|uniref:Uncharacterized protein n=1 Tax=Pseudooceanicola atlanticus TaxID=1461694 RepID=A0A0A0E8Z5_9RHOB|nr:hypothetical protein ATO9_22680 [Pseudooceanicola atlanticus]